MTIYCRQHGKTNSRYAKFTSILRKRKCLIGGLPPIYEIDEDCNEEVSFLDVKDNNHRLLTCRVVNEDHISGKRYHHTNELKTEKYDNADEHSSHHQRGKELNHIEDNKRTWTYLERNLAAPVSLSKGNSQMVFPDFFPPSMNVHCAQNALPEISKRLYMKIIEGNIKLEHSSYDATAKTVNNTSQGKQQNWMQFFG